MQANMEAQINLENLFTKNKLMTRLRSEFNIPDLISFCNDKEIPLNFAINLLSQMVLHKRASVSILVGILYKHFDEEENPFQACADMLLKSAEESLVDFDTLSEVFILRYDVSSDVYEDLDRYQYPLPMLIEPKEVKTNSDDGYYTSRKQSLLLKNNHHEDDINLDHINNVNNTPLSINVDIVNLIKNRWKNLDKQKPSETPQDFQKRVKAFEKYNKSSHDVIRSLLMYDNKFYLTHKYDKRGRCYAQGYHVNTQGNPWNKSVIEFFNKEITNKI